MCIIQGGLTMFFFTMDKNTIFAKLFRLTPFSHNVQAFIDLMAESGHSVTKSQINCWQRKPGGEKSRPVPDFALDAILDYYYLHKEELKEALASK